MGLDCVKAPVQLESDLRGGLVVGFDEVVLRVQHHTFTAEGLLVVFAVVAHWLFRVALTELPKFAPLAEVFGGEFLHLPFLDFVIG